MKSSVIYDIIDAGKGKREFITVQQIMDFDISS